MISVALCTFNGARYLHEQLASIAAQTRPPDELVASDDGSTDESVGIVERFAKSVSFPVLTHQTGERLGVVQNFAQAIALCRGEHIVLCDQDDVWLPEKLARIEASLRRNPDVGIVFSNAEVVDQGLRPLGYSLWHHSRLVRRDRVQVESGDAFSVALRHPFMTGATLAFRASLCRWLFPIPDSWMHDAWIAAIGSACADVTALPERLVLYRQHSNNVIGAKYKGIAAQVSAGIAFSRERYYAREIARFNALEERLNSVPSGLVRHRALAALNAKLCHLERRRDLPANRLRRIPGIAREVTTGGYATFAIDWRSIAADLFWP